MTLKAELIDSGTHVLVLSHTLAEVASQQVDAKKLLPDLTLGQDETWFGSVNDIASLGGGGFAVFDNMQKQIILFDSTGAETRRIGRQGDGPGEYRDAFALTRVGGKLVVWQASASSTFTVVDTVGHVVAVAGAPVKGDWIRPIFRRPLLNPEGTMMGPEDVTRRLAPWGDAGFVHQIQLNEYEHIDFAAPTDFPAPPVYLILYGLDAALRDTIANLTGPPTLVRDWVQTSNGTVVFFQQPLFSGRPVWTTGRNWIALGHGDSTRIVVRTFAGDTLVTIELPDRRREISRHDKIEAAKWIVALRLRHFPESREIFERDSPRERQKGIEWTAFELTPFARLTPTVTAAYGAGNCLFLAGYSASDYVDGTALTWVALNVRRAAVQAVFRIVPPQVGEPLALDRRGGAVRAFDEKFVFVSYADGDGVFYLSRYPLPEIDCT